MKRTLATTTLTLALLGVGACKGDAADSAKLIPDAATIVGGMDLEAFLAAKSYWDSKAMIQDSEYKDELEAVSACNLGTEAWKSIVFGVDPMKQQFAVVVRADGIGNEANLTCISGKLKAKAGKAPFVIEDKDARKMLMLDDGVVGYIVDEGTVVVASRGWAAPVGALVDGKGKSVFDGALADVLGRVDMGKALWAAGTLPADLIAGSPAQGAKDAAVSIDISGGVAIAASLGFGSADEADEKRDALQKLFDRLEGTARDMGVPQAVIDSVEIGASGSTVTVRANASDDDMAKVSGVLKDR